VAWAEAHLRPDLQGDVLGGIINRLLKKSGSKDVIPAATI
jgi:hypothetical protein